MKEELQQKLFDDFPHLFGRKSLRMTETCMCWGVECGAGWYSLIHDLCKKITEIDPKVQAEQVKEKFGGLRFYLGGCSPDTTERLYAAIDEAEKLSYKTCEMCGSTENVAQNEVGWVHTLCANCRDKK